MTKKISGFLLLYVVSFVMFNKEFLQKTSFLGLKTKSDNLNNPQVSLSAAFSSSNAFFILNDLGVCDVSYHENLDHFLCPLLCPVLLRIALKLRLVKGCFQKVIFTEETGIGRAHSLRDIASKFEQLQMEPRSEWRIHKRR